jgi:hypothetical protein
MKLYLSEIKFLKSGKISVEVRGESGDDPPKPPAVDHVRIRLYMEYAPGDSIESIGQKALQLARSAQLGAP